MLNGGEIRNGISNPRSEKISSQGRSPWVEISFLTEERRFHEIFVKLRFLLRAEILFLTGERCFDEISSYKKQLGNKIAERRLDQKWNFKPLV